MRPQTQRARECRLAAPLLWVVPVALAACTTDVDVFRTLEGRAAATKAASETSAGSGVLIKPDSVMAETDLNCRPGHYVGDFNGTYYSAAWRNGTEPLSIAATPSLGGPGLEFWLERIPRNCRSDEEFCADFTVKGGKIRGNANPFSSGNAADSGDSALALAIRFEIDIGGELDCSRGVFNGQLKNGCYDLATVLFRFEGTAPAYYDPNTSSFTEGMWMVDEKPSEDGWFPADAKIGGSGSWHARFANDSKGPAADSVSFCDM